MTPLIPSPGRPKIVSTPQSMRRSTRTSEAAVDIVCLLTFHVSRVVLALAMSRRTANLGSGASRPVRLLRPSGSFAATIALVTRQE